jgi:hypothetical protein
MLPRIFFGEHKIKLALDIKRRQAKGHIDKQTEMYKTATHIYQNSRKLQD